MSAQWLTRLAPLVQRGVAGVHSGDPVARLSLPDDLLRHHREAARLRKKGAARAPTATGLVAPPGLRERLKVKPVPDDKQKLPKNDGHEYVGRHPFRAILSGESGTGKTTLLIHLLNKFYAPYFDRIYIFRVFRQIRHYCQGIILNLKKAGTDRKVGYF